LTEQDTALPVAGDAPPLATTAPATTPGGGPIAAKPTYPPGAAPRRRGRFKIHYELLGCALHGHHLVGTDAAMIGPDDHHVVREWDGVRWYRCLRCDTWVPMPATDPPPTGRMPARDEVEVPLRGRPLRDRFVLRLIAVDRVLHFLVLGALAAAIFIFASDRNRLKGDYTRILNAIQGAVGGPLFDTKHNRLVGDINHLFTLSTLKLVGFGCVIALYAALNGIEAFGLWRARRWAEYLTFIELAALLPVEVYELSVKVTTLKALTLALNVAIVLYLLIAKRLFGIRGGAKAEHAVRLYDSGWPAVERFTPAFTGAPVSVQAPAVSPEA
jgi:uncharacterized membrane protein (DUF2068 family)